MDWAQHCLPFYGPDRRQQVRSSQALPVTKMLVSLLSLSSLTAATQTWGMDSNCTKGNESRHPTECMPGKGELQSALSPGKKENLGLFSEQLGDAPRSP